MPLLASVRQSVQHLAAHPLSRISNWKVSAFVLQLQWKIFPHGHIRGISSISKHGYQLTAVVRKGKPFTSL